MSPCASTRADPLYQTTQFRPRTKWEHLLVVPVDSWIPERLSVPHPLRLRKRTFFLLLLTMTNPLRRSQIGGASLADLVSPSTLT